VLPTGPSRQRLNRNSEKMTRWLALSRAAHLVGVSRHVLQMKIRNGELHANDGTVSTEELLRVFPQAELDASGAFERVTLIKERAFTRRVLERVLPTQEVLAQRLFAQSQELADVRRHLVRYHDLVVAIQTRLRALAGGADDQAVRALEEFLEYGLSDVLATESPDVLTVMDDLLKVMSARVTVRPSGREFLVEGHETLLEAGLRAGLRFNYGCGNGSCGLCKARVVSGSVARVRACDYPLSEAEKLQGYTLLCAHTVASGDLAIETLEASGPQEIAAQQIVAKVRAVTPLARDTCLLHLQTPRTSRLRFLAGQSALLGATGRGNDVHASFPIASCPCDDRNLQFYVGRNPDDAFAQRVFDGGLKAGDAVTVWGPQGDFVLAESDRPLVFAGCDMGFSPLKSLIEHAVASDAAESLSLYWLATRADGHFLANQCRAWSEALDQFDYSLHTDVDPAAGTAPLLQAMQADLFLGRCDFYIAGPEPFVDAAADGLRAAGVPKRQIMTLIV
jgi:CDP-4-dehydro-6-deoxyglucose reductase, E3